MADETTNATGPEMAGGAPIKNEEGNGDALPAGGAAMPGSDNDAGATGEGAGKTNFREQAQGLYRQAGDRARQFAEEGKTRTSGALDEVARLMQDAATTVDEKLGSQYGGYARQAAEGIAGFSEQLKGKDVDDLVADAQDFVRKSPAVAIGIAAALGFVVARVVKAGFETNDQSGTGGDGNTPAT